MITMGRIAKIDLVNGDGRQHLGGHGGQIDGYMVVSEILAFVTRRAIMKRSIQCIALGRRRDKD